MEAALNSAARESRAAGERGAGETEGEGDRSRAARGGGGRRWKERARGRRGGVEGAFQGRAGDVGAAGANPGWGARPPAGIQGGKIPEPPPRTPPRGSSRRFRGGLPFSKLRGTAALGSREKGEGSEATGPETVTGKASGMRQRRSGWGRDDRTRDPRGSWGPQAAALGSRELPEQVPGKECASPGD